MNIIDIIVPNLPESVMDATIISWKKNRGDFVNKNEVLVEIETDKIVLEIPATNSGILEVILEKEGSNVVSRQVLGRLKLVNKVDTNKKILKEEHIKHEKKEIKSYPTNINVNNSQRKINDNHFSPSIRRLIAEKNIESKELKFNKIKEINLENKKYDHSLEHLETNKSKFINFNNIEDKDKNTEISKRIDKRISMSRLRKRIAERLLQVKNNTAMLTTFNEVNMQPIMNLREKYGEIFKERYNIRLGLMSFCVKAVVESLKYFPEINAFIDNEDIVYHNYYDISIAVSTPRGLVTPIIRNADNLSMSDIEKTIRNLATKGKEGKLTIEELTGGNFTITNGGVFGSLMSTPIINPPQSGILGMHAIKDRPMAINGKVVILPMMYLALSYDHRIVDGKDSVKFLIKIKENLEDPIRLLLKI